MPQRDEAADAALVLVSEVCDRLKIEKVCITCNTQFAKIRQDGSGLPIILTKDGPVCKRCREGKKPIAMLASSKGIKVFTSAGTAAPHASVANSGLFTLNRPAIEMLGLPLEGELVIAWREDTQDMILGMGKEGLPGSRTYKTKENGSISFQIKNFLLYAGLKIEELTPNSPWTPYYEEDTGYIVVPIGHK